MKPSERPKAPSPHRLTQSHRRPPSIPPTRPLPPRPVTGCKQRPFRPPHLRAQHAQGTPAEAASPPRKRKSGLAVTILPRSLWARGGTSVHIKLCAVGCILNRKRKSCRRVTCPEVTSVEGVATASAVSALRLCRVICAKHQTFGWDYDLIPVVKSEKLGPGRLSLPIHALRSSFCLECIFEMEVSPSLAWLELAM
ncbi:hypothetical protein I79_002317 [Cricetulus griseus]|uniref:Uncharacterized protein n=1 Tax=Cricetulus griseus TaxID=10029 RepID=G3GX82_CRIGR|nr:hypothetical protein I79_002317 [Cricetulus griseus]